RNGDHEGYRKLCRRMFERFGQSKDPDDIALLAHTCVLLPGALGDQSRVLQLAEQRLAITKPPSLHHNWSVHVLSLAYYRSGKYQAAIDCLTKAASDYANWEERAVNWLVLSMAHQRLGHAAEARQWLDKAASRIQEKQPQRGQPFVPPGWQWRD